MRGEVQAIVLGAGPGMRMTTLTTHVPKVLLPVASIPLLAFPLHLLQQAGLTEATVVVSGGVENEVSKVGEQCGLTITADCAPVNTSADPGTADSLRHILPKIKKSVDDVILVSCDLVTDVKLQDVLDRHRSRGAALTALIAPHPPPSLSPGPKTKPNLNSDVIVSEKEGGRLVTVVAGGDYDESVPLPSRHTPIPLLASTALLDAHLYIIKRNVLEAVLSKESPCRDMGSFKAEILPYIVSSQFSECGHLGLEDSGYEELVSRYNTSVVPSRFHNSANLATDALYCQLYHHKGVCIRINTLPAYWDINRQMSSLVEKVVPCLDHPLCHPSAEIHPRAQVSEDSMVGGGALVCERTNITSSVLGRHCRVETMSRVSSSVLGDHTSICSGCVVENSLVWGRVERRCVLKNCIVTDPTKIEEGKTYTNEVLEATQDFA